MEPTKPLISMENAIGPFDGLNAYPERQETPDKDPVFAYTLFCTSISLPSSSVSFSLPYGRVLRNRSRSSLPCMYVSNLTIC